MKIICDSREQKPYSFKRWPDVEVQRGTLFAGDYSLSEYESQVAVERKTLDDLIACLMGQNRERFERELSRTQEYEMFAVVAEAAWGDVSKGQYKSNMRPHSALQSITAFIVRYNIPFFFPGSRAGAEYLTHSLLSKYIYEQGRDNQKNCKQLEVSNEI